MKKLLKIVVLVAGALVGGLVVLAAIGFWSLSHHADYSFPDHDLPSHLTGRWDWSTRAHRCDDSAHVIAFSPDRERMTIAMPPHPPDTGWTATYDVLELTPSRLRGAIRGEKRLTAGGEPVVWDLVMFGPNEYHWHRTDWASWQYTGAVVRCGPDGGAALPALASDSMDEERLPDTDEQS
jgi:hypothetical protein